MKSISQTLKAGLFQITATWLERDRTLEKVVRIINQRPDKHKATSPLPHRGVAGATMKVLT